MLGLAAAAAWGAGDFGGGLTSRRAPVFGVVLLSQFVGMAIALGHRHRSAASPCRRGTDLLLCLVAGILGGIGITALYRGLAIGRMGIVAPVTGVLAAVIPVIGGIVLEGLPADDGARRASASRSSRSCSSHASRTRVAAGPG